MQINNVKLNHPRKKRKTIGRGGRKGTYSGRGNKGQKARTGAHVDPLFEGGRSTLIDHMKKKKGFKSLKIKVVVVQLADLAKKFKDGDIVSKETLIKAGIIDTIVKGKIKILGKAILKKKFTVNEEILLSVPA